MAETNIVVDGAGKKLVKPSFPRFIIALFLVKSKPIGLSVPALQECITYGAPPDQPPNSRSHLDTSGFWHEQYKKLEESQIELRAKIVELESLRAAETASGQIQRKRKMATVEPEQKLCSNAQKRSRTPVLETVPQSMSDSLKPLGDQLTTSSLDRNGSNLPQDFFNLQRLASTGTPCGHNLAVALFQVSSDIRLILSSITASKHTNIGAICNVTTRSQWRNSSEAERRASNDVDTRLAAIGCIFPCVLNALSQLTEGSQGVAAQPRIVHDIIALLRDLLEQLLLFAAKNNWKSPYAKCQTWKNLQSKVPFPLPDDVVMKICRLAMRLVTSLDLRRVTDQQILDGFLYFLLGHIGAMLKFFVFGCDSSEILRSNHEGQALKVTPISYDEERKRAEAQAPYLIYILAQIIPLAEKHPKLTTIHAVQTPRLSTPTLKSARLSHPAFATLQSTLLAEVFGPESSAEFSDALAPPLSNNLDAETRSGFEPDAGGLSTPECMADWFKAEVWRVLGWEVLSGKIAWDK